MSKKNKIDLVYADIVSRKNALNGKYKVGKFGLDFWDKDYVFELPEMVLKRANMIDELIETADKSGKDTSDLNVLKIINEEVRTRIGSPILKNESVLTAIFVGLQIILYYSIAIGIWGLALNKSIVLFGLSGFVLGLVVSLLFIAPVIVNRRTKEGVRDMVFVTSSLWGNFAIIIGVLGIMVWIVRFII